MPRERLFLERRSYRLRRMMDAIRLLPVLGLCLWFVPLMWPVASPESDGISTSLALRYIFSVWLLLVVGAWLLWRHTHDAVEKGADPDPDTPEPR